MRFETKKILKKLKPYCKNIVQSTKETHFEAILENGDKIFFSIASQDPMKNWNFIRQDFKKRGINLPVK